MAVMPMPPREAWTDERLDDLNARVGRIEVRMDAGFAEMREEFRTVNDQFAAQNRMIIQLFAGMFGTVVIGILGVIATIIAQT